MSRNRETTQDTVPNVFSTTSFTPFVVSVFEAQQQASYPSSYDARSGMYRFGKAFSEDAEIEVLSSNNDVRSIR